MRDEMPTEGCLLNIQFDPPLLFDGTPHGTELANRVFRLQVERDAAVALLRRLLAGAYPDDLLPEIRALLGMPEED